MVVPMPNNPHFFKVFVVDLLNNLFLLSIEGLEYKGRQNLEKVLLKDVEYICISKEYLKYQYISPKGYSKHGQIFSDIFNLKGIIFSPPGIT